MTSAPLAAVTGGTGFLGRTVVARLRADGWRVRQLVRTPRAAPGELVEGSLADEDALRRLVAGADVVVHMAALTHCRDAKGFRLVNVGGARNLGKAIRVAAPAARVVAVSSLAAREPTLSPYAATKAAGEVALLESARAASSVVLRPCALYGPGDRASLPVFRAAMLPLVPVPRRPRARMALLHVEDAGRAVVAACSPEAGTASWEVGDGAHGWSAIARAAAAALGRDPPLVAVPGAVVAAALAVARLLAGGGSPVASPGKVAELLHGDWACDPDRLPPPSLWRPRVGLEDGFRRTAEWYRSNGWL